MTYDELSKRLRYDPATGIFTWIAGGRFNRCAGKQAGSVEAQGYIVVSVGPGRNKNRVKAHRLAWLFMTGEWPDHEVDHINGNRSDNQWQNLRKASDGENARNRARASNNTTGFKGVSVINGLYRARFCVDGKTIDLGCYASPEQAHAVRSAAVVKAHGEFARIQ